MTTIIEVPVPLDAGDPNTWAARAEALLWNAENLAQLGYADLNDPEETAATLAVPSSGRRTMRWVALDDPDDHSTLVGAVSCSLTLKDNLNIAGIHGIVRPDRRGQGIGTRLFDVAERRAAEEGRGTLQSWVMQVGGPDADGPGVLAPKEGSGFIDASRPSPSFMLGRGYTLEQVEVHSMLPVPVAPDVIDPLADEAARRVGDSYRLVDWRDRCPDELLDAFARLRVAMIDAPAAGVQQEAAYWDADRVREVESRWAAAGVDTLTTAAQHVDTGELAGYTELVRFRGHHDSAIQEDTVVVEAHRGHRLGMHLKVANLRLVAEHWPLVRRIHTWNADENDYMRSINIALGFRPESNEGAWQKRL